MEGLAKTNLFRILETDNLQALTHGARRPVIQRGEHVFHQGDKLDHYYLLQSGCIRLYRLGHEGHEKVYQEISEGTIFAETVAFQKDKLAPLSAVAVRKSKLLQLDSLKLLKLFEKSPDFALTIAANMADNLYSAVSRIDQLTVNKSAQRLVMFLAELYQTQNTRWLKLPFTQGILARQLNIEPETLSRMLTKFRDAGCLSVKGKDCVILEPDQLCSMVSLPSTTLSSNKIGSASSDLLRCCGIR
ncbi:Crp/Fnr family transcriptional regulator [Neptuniibacter marinus]|uniref:Crp/Fnr family transcriptional regulator n=1 Tax=Neptuniibacter marinus TaxID=1806670 RepID=UPI00082A023D|nr:Crp/Fnr family transcriptional regulator [Neptuniibacter marinus]